MNFSKLNWLPIYCIATISSLSAQESVIQLEAAAQDDQASAEKKPIQQEMQMRTDKNPPDRRGDMYGVTGYASFIYWMPYEDGLEFALTGMAATVNTTTPPTQQGRMYRPDFNFSPGFQLGASYQYGTEWDLNTMWTWLYSRATQNVSSEPAGVTAGLQPNDLWAVWNAVGGGYGAVNFANATWSLHYNTVELTAGIPCMVGKKINLKPAFGLLFASIDQAYKVVYGGSSANRETIHIQNNFCGGGFRGLVDGFWDINRYFGFTTRAGFGLLLGNFNVLETQTASYSATYLYGNKFVNVGNDPLTMKPETDFSFGVRGMVPIYRNRYELKFALEWDFISWLDQNQMIKFYGSNPLVSGSLVDPYRGHVVTQHGDLFLQGLTLTAGCEF